MDPLSIIASSIAIIGAAISSSEVIISFISGIRNLPAELETTSRDVAEFRTVLFEVESSVRLEEVLLQALPDSLTGRLTAIIPQLPAASTDAFERIKAIGGKLSEIDASVKRISSSEYLGRLKLLERKKLQVLRQDLRDIKLSISAHFSVKSGRLSLQSLVSLQQISGYLIQASRDSARQENVLQHIQQYMRHSQSLQDEQNRFSALVEALNSRMLESCHISPPASPSLPVTETYPISLLPQPDAQPDEDRSFAPGTGNDLAVSETTSLGNPYYNSVFKLDFSRFSKKACKPFCSCICHRRHRRRMRNGKLGSFAIGVSSLPFFRPTCTEGCTNRSKFSATVTYYFPTWFFLRVISLLFVTSIFGDPWIGIKVRPMTQAFSIFRHAASGNLDGLKRLLGRKEVHPSASFEGGWTGLHYAISNGHANVCRLLISEKADPLIEDGANSQSALEWAWCKILGNSFESKRLQEFEAIFTDRECLEEFGFTPLHKKVLKLVPGDLKVELGNLTLEEVNATDFGGRTALSWASQRGDFSAVTELLTHGADPNIVTPTRMAPLFYACEALNPTCITPLLLHGADVHASDHALHTALHFASQHHNDIAYLTPLINAGADVEAKTEYDYTPLTAALGKNYFNTVSYLLTHGASANTPAQYGQLPLMYAIEYNSHDCLQILLSHGADFMLECKNGPTAAHYVAEFADIHTVKMLNEAELPFLPLESLEMEGRHGMTIEEIVTKRLREGDGVDGEFMQAFNCFIRKIMDPRELEKRGFVEEVWEDAMEQQIETSV